MGGCGTDYETWGPASPPTWAAAAPLVVLRDLGRVRAHEEVGEQLVAALFGAELELREQVSELVSVHLLHGGVLAGWRRKSKVQRVGHKYLRRRGRAPPSPVSGISQSV